MTLDEILDGEISIPLLEQHGYEFKDRFADGLIYGRGVDRLFLEEVERRGHYRVKMRYEVGGGLE